MAQYKLVLFDFDGAASALRAVVPDDMVHTPAEAAAALLT